MGLDDVKSADVYWVMWGGGDVLLDLIEVVSES